MCLNGISTLRKYFTDADNHVCFQKSCHLFLFCNCLKNSCDTMHYLALVCTEFHLCHLIQYLHIDTYVLLYSVHLKGLGDVKTLKIIPG